jgi:hypothetical protein
MLAYFIGEDALRIVRWFVADHPARAGNTPEAAGVVGNTVEDLEGDAVVVTDI